LTTAKIYDRGALGITIDTKSVTHFSSLPDPPQATIEAYFGQI